MSWALWVTILLLVPVMWWLVSVARRVRTRRRNHGNILATRVPSRLPPAGHPRNEPKPQCDKVDWPALSTSVGTDGVFLTDYDAAGNRGVKGKQKNPYSIASFGIKNAKAFVETGEPNTLLLAFRQFEHIRESAVHESIAGQAAVTWRADFDLEYQYQARAPWKSAYFQIHCIEALYWGHWLFGDSRYRELAQAGVPPLATSVTDGGLSHVTENDGLFFQEVVTQPLHHILNGHLSTLLALHYLSAYTGSPETALIFERGVAGTVDMLSRFDRRGYSLYSLSPNPGFRNHFNIASATYHHHHIAQLKTLHEFTGKKVFDEFASRWEKQTKGVFDLTWTTAFVVFKDLMRLTKSS